MGPNLCEVCKLPFRPSELIVESHPSHLVYRLEEDNKEFHFHNKCFHKRLLEVIIGREI